MINTFDQFSLRVKNNSELGNRSIPMMNQKTFEDVVYMLYCVAASLGGRAMVNVDGIADFIVKYYGFPCC